MLQSIPTEAKLIGAMVLVIVLTILGWINIAVYESQDELVQEMFIEQNNIYIQQLPLRAQNYYETYDNVTFKALRENISIIEQTIEGITEGGTFERNQHTYELEPIKGKEVQQHINAFNREFKQHKEQLQKLVASNITQSETGNALIKLKSNAALALNFLAENNERLVVLNNRIGDSVYRFVESGRNRTRLILFLVILGIISSAIYGIYLFRVIYMQRLHDTLKDASSAVQLTNRKQVTNPNAIQELQLLLRTIMEGVNEATNFARSIGEGQLNKTLSESVEKGDLGSALLEMRDKLISFSEEERRQTWFNNGIAEVAQILNSHKLEEIESLSFSFLKFIVKYLNLNQGAVFLRESEQNDLFTMQACYAFDKKKFLSKTIRVGEGLIGQCIAEESTTYTEKVPEQYVHITSGLGTAPPRVLLIVPIKEQTNLYGAIELASFHPITPHEIEFVEAACGRFASIMATLQVSLNTQRLLNETQRVNQELQEKEEEMKQNALQLENTQKILNDKLAELESETNLSRNIIDAINKTSATVEFDLEGNILEVNEMYLSIMGYTRKELVGSNERALVPQEELDTNRYQLLWNSLQRGSFISGEYKRVNKFGKEIWLNGTYNPIFDVEGTPYKIIQIAQFTTEEKEKDLDYTSKINAISNSFPMIDLDTDEKIISGNATFASFLGYKRKDFRNRTLTAFLQLEERQHFQEIWDDVLSGKMLSETLRFETSTHEERYCIVNMNPIYNLSGKIYKVLVILIDITAQKKLEISLTKNKEELSHTVSELEVVQQYLNSQKLELETRIRMLDQAAFIFEIDLHQNISAANKALCAKLATTRTQLVHKPFIEIVDHPRYSRPINELFKAFENEAVYREIIPYHSFDGKVWWGDTTIARMLDNYGKITRYIGITFDITQQIEQEQALRESLVVEKAKNALLHMQRHDSEKALQTLLEKLDVEDNGKEVNVEALAQNDLLPTLLLNNQGQIITLNELASNLFSYQPAYAHTAQGELTQWVTLKNGAEKDSIAKILQEGRLMEESIILHKNDGKEDFRGMFIPIFSNKESDSRTLLVLTKA